LRGGGSQGEGSPDEAIPSSMASLDHPIAAVARQSSSGIDAGAAFP
jgi:hypothetical protein